MSRVPENTDDEVTHLIVVHEADGSSLDEGGALGNCTPRAAQCRDMKLKEGSSTGTALAVLRSQAKCFVLATLLGLALLVLSMCLDERHLQKGSVARETSQAAAMVTIREHTPPVYIVWHAQPDFCLGLEGNVLLGSVLNLVSVSRGCVSFRVPIGFLQGTIQLARHRNVCLARHEDGGLRVNSCRSLPHALLLFKLNLDAKGVGTISTVGKSHLCMAAGNVPMLGRGASLKLTDCNTPTSDALYFATVPVGTSGPLGLSEQSILENSTKQGHDRITRLSLASNPDKCLRVERVNQTAGQKLMVWDCSAQPDRFVLPPAGQAGPIRWAHNQDLCLDVLKHHGVQFWHCNSTPPEHREFLVFGNNGTEGRIRWAAKPELCLDVPLGNTDNGIVLHLWDCEATKQEHILFREELPPGHPQKPASLQWLKPVSRPPQLRPTQAAPAGAAANDTGANVSLHVERSDSPRAKFVSKASMFVMFFAVASSVGSLVLVCCCMWHVSRL